jgi:hypothetical protein
MFDDGYGTYVEDAQIYDPANDNGYEDPWTSAQYGTVDFLGPQEESQFEGFDSTLTGEDNVTYFDSSWDNAVF